jgi:hypothetical protein
MVLKLAYQRDPELQRLAKALKRTNNVSFAGLGAIAGGTVAQSATSLYVLNPPDGVPDSYVPGALGLGMSGATNIVFGARALFSHSYRKKYRERQMLIQQQVEEVLHHLEFSKTTCPEARKELVILIGERASQDFVELWRSSHPSRSAVATATSAVVH